MNTSNSTTCYYHLVPPDPTTTDSTGYIRGSDLRETRGYERLVDMLSRFQAGTTPETEDRQQVYTAVDEMKFKSGAILLAPCHPGHTAADRTIRAPTDQTERRDSPDMDHDRVRARRSTESACQPAGFWQRALRFATQFLTSVTPQTAPAKAGRYMALTARDTDCPPHPTLENANQAKEAEFDVREYERHLMAVAFSTAT
jgi:hypothetical protein